MKKRINYLSFVYLIVVCILVFPGCEGLTSFFGGKGDKPKEEEVNYWKDVTFDFDDFKKTLEIINKHYIDPDYDRNLSYVYAANFALLTLKEPKEIIP